MALLLFHDAVELFVLLLAEKTGAKIRARPSFLDYWDSISSLPFKSSMARLNAARRTLKHQGIEPSPEIARELTAIVSAFFKEATQDFLGIDFTSISMIDLIPEGGVKDRLIVAERALSEGNVDEATIEAAKAWHVLSRRLPLYMSDSRRFSSSRTGSSDAIDAIGNWVADLSRIVMLSILDLPLADYRRFISLCPVSVHQSLSGEFQIRDRVQVERKTEDAQFCIDFVTSAAVAGQRRFLEGLSGRRQKQGSEDAGKP